MQLAPKRKWRDFTIPKISSKEEGKFHNFCSRYAAVSLHENLCDDPEKKALVQWPNASRYTKIYLPLAVGCRRRRWTGSSCFRLSIIYEGNALPNNSVMFLYFGLDPAIFASCARTGSDWSWTPSVSLCVGKWFLECCSSGRTDADDTLVWRCLVRTGPQSQFDLGSTT